MRMKGQAVIEYILVLSILSILFMSLGLDLLTSTTERTRGSEVDLLLRKMSMELESAVTEVEQFRTYRSVSVTPPRGAEGICTIVVEKHYVQAECMGINTILAASRSVEFTTPAINNRISSGSGVIHIAPHNP